MESDLFKQLEGKKKGCGIDLGAYMEVPKEYENAPDKIRKEKSFRVEVICGKQEYCPTCKSELKGRLEAMKEEVEFLRNWRCKLNLWIAGLKLKDERIDKFIEIIDIYEDKINFLKEQIKQIEGKK